MDSFGGEEKKQKGGICLVAWGKACRPPELGGLGISDLKSVSWALRMRWIWLKKTEPNRPWENLPVQVPGQVQTFFKLAVISVVGSGANTLFWTDRWLNGQSIADLAPRLLAVVPKRIANRRAVEEAMADRSWVMDIRGDLSV